ncbi:DUF4214 domain-containing protein [Pseudomonas sp. Marseille-Q0931]|uniref:DUF4214 domain-containing protein n=1 Tax=Pseudomonas sp. Marseille-Q0931 TaxID=2697507 RepID=UPI0023B88CBC|nr:DUF4214 domain-containing protein [Pseudomonas sp. Marseille-Q0931]
MATASDLQQLYIGYFGRAADQAGLNFWLDAINSGGLSLDNVHTAFVNSDEYNAQYEGMTVSEKVAAVYENVLGRVADEAGLEFWTNAINTGLITEDQLIEGLLSGLSANDAAIISNKIVVANYYTSAKGDAYVEASKAESAGILAGVDATVASVSAALNDVAAVTGVSNAQLASALATLDAAQDAQQAYAEAYLGAAATKTPADVATAQGDINAAVGTAATALNNAITAVGGTAIDPTPGTGDSAANITVKIQSAVTLAANNVTTAQAGVSAVTGLTAKVNTFNSQLAAFENAVKAANAAELEQDAEQAKFEVVNGGAVTINANGTIANVIVLDSSNNLVLDSTYAAGANPTQLAAANELLKDIKTSLAAEKAQTDAAAALDKTGAQIDALGADAYTAVVGDTAGSFAGGPAADLVEALAEQKALQDAIPPFNEAAADAAEYQALADAITAAETAITSGLGYTVEVVDAATEAGTAGKDVFLVGDTDSTITITAGDVLFVGPGFKLGTDTDKTTVKVEGGDASVLEVFLTQANGAGNVHVVVEQTAFGSNAATQEVTTIELAGVTDISKVSFDAQTGLISIA